MIQEQEIGLYFEVHDLVKKKAACIGGIFKIMIITVSRPSRERTRLRYLLFANVCEVLNCFNLMKILIKANIFTEDV